MVGLHYMKKISYLSSSFCEVSGFSDETSDSCSKFAAESIDLSNAYFFIARISNNFSFMDSDDFSVDAISDFLSE
jgi:uncharacterized membrane protein